MPSYDSLQRAAWPRLLFVEACTMRQHRSEASTRIRVLRACSVTALALASAASTTVAAEQGRAIDPAMERVITPDMIDVSNLAPVP